MLPYPGIFLVFLGGVELLGFPRGIPGASGIPSGILPAGSQLHPEGAGEDVSGLPGILRHPGEVGSHRDLPERLPGKSLLLTSPKSLEKSRNSRSHGAGSSNPGRDRDLLLIPVLSRLRRVWKTSRKNPRLVRNVVPVSRNSQNFFSPSINPFPELNFPYGSARPWELGKRLGISRYSHGGVGNGNGELGNDSILFLELRHSREKARREISGGRWESRNIRSGIRRDH